MKTEKQKTTEEKKRKILGDLANKMWVALLPGGKKMVGEDMGYASISVITTQIATGEAKNLEMYYKFFTASVTVAKKLEQTAINSRKTCEEIEENARKS